MKISAKLIECPTRNVFEARGVSKASSNLFNPAIPTHELNPDRQRVIHKMENIEANQKYVNC
jgi:hypothetical protein